MIYSDKTDYIDFLLNTWDDVLWKNQTEKPSGIERTYYNTDLLNHITQVVYHDPATIVYFDDGDKVVVKTSPHDDYNPEAGLALCILKKMLGNNSAKFHKFFKTWEADTYYD